jgi:hypothetical protein
MINESKNINANENENNEEYNEMMLQIEQGSEYKNVQLSLLLMPKYYGKNINKHLVISTYHMPCKYEKRYLMMSHIVAIKQNMHAIIKSWKLIYKNVNHHVLCIDLNSTPTSIEYKYMIGNNENTDINVDDVVKIMRKIFRDDMIQSICFKSSYFHLNNIEPKYTCVNVRENATFMDCIDYIFTSDNIGVRSSTIGLMVDDPIKTNYPNKLCPSDHLPLSTSLFMN